MDVSGQYFNALIHLYYQHVLWNGGSSSFFLAKEKQLILFFRTETIELTARSKNRPHRPFAGPLIRGPAHP
jgi:hypothetical protein